MRVLVTGGFGYLGAHVAERFRRAGDDVRILGRSVHEDMAEWAEDFEVVLADISDPDQLVGACDGIDAVVHAASLNAGQSAADPKRAVEVTGLGTRYLLDEAMRGGVERFVYLSTMHVYGPGLTGVVDESHPTCAANDYSSTHLLAETYCRAAAAEDMTVAIARPSNGYGAPIAASADCWMLAVNDFCRQAVAAGEIVLNSSGTALRDFIEIRDIAGGVELLARTELGKPSGSCEVEDRLVVLNIGGGDVRTIRDAAEAVARVASARLGADVTVSAPATDGTAPDFEYSSRRITELGYSTEHPFDDSVEELLRFVTRTDGPQP
jgi:UDP-glucose 4-epimerase